MSFVHQPLISHDAKLRRKFSLFCLNFKGWPRVANFINSAKIHAALSTLKDLFIKHCDCIAQELG